MHCEYHCLGMGSSFSRLQVWITHMLCPLIIVILFTGLIGDTGIRKSLEEQGIIQSPLSCQLTISFPELNSTSSAWSFLLRYGPQPGRRAQRPSAEL